MWMPPETTHTCQGRMRSMNLCEHCYHFIRKGERYHRRFFSDGVSSFSMHEHANRRDCPKDRVLEPQHEVATTKMPVAVQMTIKQIEVVALDTAGNSFTEQKTVVEMETVTLDDETDF